MFSFLAFFNFQWEQNEKQHLIRDNEMVKNVGCGSFEVEKSKNMSPIPLIGGLFRFEGGN